MPTTTIPMIRRVNSSDLMRDIGSLTGGETPSLVFEFVDGNTAYLPRRHDDLESGLVCSCADWVLTQECAHLDRVIPNINDCSDCEELTWNLGRCDSCQEGYGSCDDCGDEYANDDLTYSDENDQYYCSHCINQHARRNSGRNADNIQGATRITIQEGTVTRWKL